MKENNEEWISCYIFHNTSFEKVLVNLIEPLIKLLNKKELITQFFYVRYWEKGPHVRLRVLPKNINFKNEIEVLIKSKVNNYFDNATSDLEYKLEFNNYIQEIQRYGGADTIKITESHFYDSSKLVLEIIKNNVNKWDYSLAISYAIQIQVLFLKEIIKDQQEITFYSKLLFKKMLPNSIKLKKNLITEEESGKTVSFFVNSYTSQKNNIDFLVKSIWEADDSGLWVKDWVFACNQLSLSIGDVGELTPEWFEYNSELNLSKKKQALWSILDSYVHMTNNRLGIHLRDEAFIAFLIFNGLKSLNEN